MATGCSHRIDAQTKHPTTLFGGYVMPFINVKIIEGVFSSDQKHEIVRKLTDAMVSIEGENMRPVTWCVLEEVKSGDWGIAGNPLSTEDVLALATGKAAG
jgi:4-oxalocrotonate tautomerase